MIWFDVIFFAIVAVVLGYRLYSVLGQRHGEERQRNNVYDLMEKVKEQREQLKREQQQPSAGTDAAPASATDPLTEQPATTSTYTPPAFKEAPESLAGKIERVQHLDPSFNEKMFLQGAKAAFEIILKAFAAEDTPTLRPLLSDDVYDSFAAAIRARQSAKEKLSIQINRIKDAEIVDALLEMNTAHLSVRMVSEQTQFTRNASGATINGDAVTPQELVDVWTFTRNLRSNDPAWRLSATRSGE